MDDGLGDLIGFISRKWMLDVLDCFVDEDELRFHQLSDALGAVPNKTLSRRLQELQDRGLMTVREVGPDHNGTCYELTPDGEELLGCLQRLDRCRRSW